jgi:hypothetical protein
MQNIQDRADQDVGILDLDDTEMDPQIAYDPLRPGYRPSPASTAGAQADEKRIVELLEGRGATDVHPGGPGVGGD